MFYTVYLTLNFNDESLKSALSEIVSIINSRPLTFISVEQEDDEAITLNQLAFGWR